MSSETHNIDHSHSEIHLPPPSWGPIVVALGVTLLASGLVFAPIAIVGIVVLLIGIWKVSGFTILAEHAPSMGLNSRTLGMWVFLASEIMFFAGLVATFLGYQGRAGDTGELLNVPLMTIGTFVLLSSSFGAVSALSALQKGRMTQFRNWLIATMVMGGVFLALELTEWFELMNHGITTGTLYGSAFYTLTGFHGLHVVIGLSWMAFLLVRLMRGKLSPSDSETGVEVFGLYWHFVDIVWIILFTIVYLI